MNDRLQILLEKYAEDQTSAAETEEMFRLIAESDADAIDGELYKLLLKSKPSLEYDEGRWNVVLSKAINNGDAVRRESAAVRTPVRTIYLRRALVAAVIAGALFVGGYWLFVREAGTTPSKPVIVHNAFIQAPATDKAILQLEDGTGYALDSVLQQKPQRLGQFVQNEDGALVYSGNSQQKGMHMITNPRGSKVVQLQLGDGTRIWLNAESMVRYPVAFNGDRRQVEVTGEVYFEVAKDANRPFIVTSNGIKTEVLGTHFNVNSYANEGPVKITLLEGAVKLSAENSSLLLQPGEQGVADGQLQKHTVKNPDAVIAWKNGFFSFSHQSMAELINELSRWYDIKIEYDKALAEKHFGGGIERGADLGQVMQILKEFKINCRLEGRTLYLNK
jgi:transmembrane sensor